MRAVGLCGRLISMKMEKVSVPTGVCPVIVSFFYHILYCFNMFFIYIIYIIILQQFTGVLTTFDR